MKGQRTFSVAVVGVLILLAALLLWNRFHHGPPRPKLSILFIGLTNNPTRQMTPTRIEAGQGATGVCAMFFVQNITSNQFLWFKTDSVEQKTDTGWQPFSLGRIGSFSWDGVGGSVWLPGYGCYYAVAWPPGLPSNAVWRLQVSYGKDPSSFGRFVNRQIGWDLFRSGKQESSVSSPEVRQ